MNRSWQHRTCSFFLQKLASNIWKTADLMHETICVLVNSNSYIVLKDLLAPISRALTVVYTQLTL